MSTPSDQRPNRDPRSAIKKRDTWWPTLFSGPVANLLVRGLTRYPGVRPDHVSLSGFAVALSAAACFYLGTYPALVTGALLVQVSFILDCADGQLARHRSLTSPFGAVLDRTLDRIKPPLYLMTLAWGAYRFTGDESFWVAAFLGTLGSFLVDFYRQQFFLLVDEAGPPRGQKEEEKLPIVFRLLDVPFIRLAGGDHYFLMSLLCVFHVVWLLLCFTAIVAMLQVLLRPVYYLLAFRRDYGMWPWVFPWKRGTP